MRRFKKELYVPKLFSKMDYNSWEQQGKITAVDYARKELKKRLKSYQMPEMTPEQDEVLRSYIGDLADTI